MGQSHRHAKWNRQAAAALACALTVVAGCDRGEHPVYLDRPAPLFTVNDGQHAVDLGQLRGQVVLLNFWATWCAPCLEEMPSLEALQRDLPGVRLVAVATDADPAAYSSYLRRHPLPFFTVLDTAQVSNMKFGTYRFPETYIIDKGGVIRRKFIGPQDWTSADIEDVLRKLGG